ncbi:unnamed protein product, partial [Arabidopsis halleri]
SAPLLRRHSTPDRSDTPRAIIGRSSSVIDAALIRMIFQTTIYHVWRERNGRIHNSGHHHYEHLITFIVKNITDRISSLKYKPGSKYGTLEARWISLRNSPT